MASNFYCRFVASAEIMEVKQFGFLVDPGSDGRALPLFLFARSVKAFVVM